MAVSTEHTGPGCGSAASVRLAFAATRKMMVAKTRSSATCARRRFATIVPEMSAVADARIPVVRTAEVHRRAVDVTALVVAPVPTKMSTRSLVKPAFIVVPSTDIFNATESKPVLAAKPEAAIVVLLPKWSHVTLARTTCARHAARRQRRLV